MSLSRAGDIAAQSLVAISTQIETASRNIAGASTPGYSAKTGLLYTGYDGGPQIDVIARATSTSLFRSNLQATAGEAALTPVSNGLSQLDAFLNISSNSATSTSNSQSPAALIAAFTTALQQYGADPSNAIAAQTALTSAQAVTQGLNAAASETQQIRQTADLSIASSVSAINSILLQFQQVNNDIISGTQNRQDVSDKLDQRDNLLTKLSADVGIRTVLRSNNDIVIYTDSGATLFETTPRQVTFKQTAAFDASTTGNAVFVDGAQITGSGAGNLGVRGGKLAGLTQLRDTVAPIFQSQLDETARGLIFALSETDQTNSASPASPGLFTFSGATSVSATNVVPGLAGKISINANVDPTQRGDINRLRDGGISHPGEPAYVYNSTGAAGYSTRILQIINSLSTPQTFDVRAGLGATQSITTYATASLGWLGEQRQQTSNSLSYQTALVGQSATALSNATGVNIDEQMSKILALENSYQASAKLLSTVDSLFTTLITALQHP